MTIHKTYHIVGELVASRWWRAGREEQFEQESILVDFLICGATQESSALWRVRDVALEGGQYTHAGWRTIKVEEVHADEPRTTT